MFYTDEDFVKSRVAKTVTQKRINVILNFKMELHTLQHTIFFKLFIEKKMTLTKRVKYEYIYIQEILIGKNTTL